MGARGYDPVTNIFFLRVSALIRVVPQSRCLWNELFATVETSCFGSVPANTLATCELLCSELCVRGSRTNAAILSSLNIGGL